MKKFGLLEMDRQRKLRYGMAAIRLIEQTFNKKISALGNFSEMGIEEINKMIYCGLKADDPSLKPEDCLILIDEHYEFSEIMEKMNEAFELAFGKPKDESFLAQPVDPKE